MLKSALLIFAAVIAVLVVLALQPGRERALPDSRIDLQNATISLYPEADSEAVWSFATPRATFDPDRGETALFDLEDGRRTVEGETDFTVSAERLLIDRRDDIRGELIFAHLVETGECLTMRGGQGSPVVIDQRRAMFDVPVLEIDGPGYGEGTRFERVRVSFDLEDFEAGGAGTTTTAVFRVGEAQEQRRITLCEDS